MTAVRTIELLEVNYNIEVRFCSDPDPGPDPVTNPLYILEKKLQCCGSGSGIRCLFDPKIRDPE
jgi:hypothetical protein